MASRTPAAMAVPPMIGTRDRYVRELSRLPVRRNAAKRRDTDVHFSAAGPPPGSATQTPYE